MGALLGLFVGYLSFRSGLRGSYFALITLAFAELLRVLANSVEFTGGGVGLFLTYAPGFYNLQFNSPTGFYYFSLILLVISLVIAMWLERSRFGAQLVAIRENEDAAEALGVDTLKCKIYAIMIMGGMGGAAGTFYAQKYLYIDPPISYSIALSVEMLLVTIVGGMGTVFGPLIGSFVLHAVNEIARHFISTPGLSLIVYGFILIVIISYLPNGLVGLFRKTQRNFQIVHRLLPQFFLLLVPYDLHFLVLVQVAWTLDGLREKENFCGHYKSLDLLQDQPVSGSVNTI